ncbi:MAG: thymidylate kinase [Parcubacteria group bacterium Gr01-1014_19]|nr:MAG: thymidylate kinase [Parcubacteria group bacterium Gr01-1014_19]
MEQGKIIVIEGTDGSGKGTQAKILRERLTSKGFSVVGFSFPQHGEPSAVPVDQYLNGAFGDPDKVDPYLASTLFALDRSAAKNKLKEIRETGKIGVLDRYVDSNAGHQGGKISDPKEREKFLAWLYDLEYRQLGIPKPDLVIILRVPPRISQEMIAKKAAREYLLAGTHDGHENNLRHLENAEAAYIWLAQHDPEIHRLIECSDGSQLFPPEQIAEMIWREVEPQLIHP